MTVINTANDKSITSTKTEKREKRKIQHEKKKKTVRQKLYKKGSYFIIIVI